MYEVIKRLVDDSEFEEYKADYGKTIITALMRASMVGRLELSQISGNLSKTPKAKCSLAALSITTVLIKPRDLLRIVIRKKIPLVFLQDVTGFMVGSKSEHSGIIKDGAKMVNALSNSVVPKFTSYNWKQLWRWKLCDVWQSV